VVKAWLARLASAVAADLRAFAEAVRPRRPRPGLHAYRIDTPEGSRRLHLRVDADGSGVAFVDVSHAIHLTPTAVEVTHSLLSGTPAAEVEAIMRRRHPEAPRAQVTGDVRALAEVVAALRRPGRRCPTCSPQLAQEDLFQHGTAAPYKADLALTYACNNACGHCYNPPDRRPTGPLDARQWAQAIRKLTRIGIPHLIFTGGEPTLCDFLPGLVACAARLGLVAGLNTNGRRLADRAYAGTLRRRGLEHVQITLASPDPTAHNLAVGANAFRETVRGLQNALNVGLHTITNTTLTHANRHQARELVDFVHGLGVRTFAMNGVICSGRGRGSPQALTEAELTPIVLEVSEHAAELGMTFLWYTPTEYCRLSPLELGLGAKSCNAAEYSICVEPNGDVLPCQSYYESAGNLLRDEWDTIWDSPLFRRLRLRRSNPRLAGLDERCYDCPDLPVCGGGCPLQREARRKEAVLRVP
jgi:radical SAM protein with 4Fe4S-binding SPASM domain